MVRYFMPHLRTLRRSLAENRNDPEFREYEEQFVDEKFLRAIFEELIVRFGIVSDKNRTVDNSRK